jgi:hypothetical protein
MKTFHIAGWLVIAAAVSAGTAHAQVLNGKYGGEGEGTDVNGSVLHQVTKWTFKAGNLVALEEIITFPNSNSTPLACAFVPSTPPPYPYSTGAPGSNPVIMIGFGCPNASTNERPEALVVIPERKGTEFSYLEYSVFSTQAFDLDPSAHFSGHATIR